MAKGKAGPSKVWCFYGVIDTQTNICKWFSHSKNDKIKMRAKHYQFHPISMSFDYSSTFFHDNLMTSKYKYRSLLVLLVLGEPQKPRFGPAWVRTTENKWKQNIQRSKIWFDAQIIRLLHSNIFKQYSAATASSNFCPLTFSCSAPSQGSQTLLSNQHGRNATCATRDVSCKYKRL